MDPEKIGPYRVLQKLGSGGMGNVYLGEHEESGRQAAVKVLSASLARESGFVERFNREVDAMHKLDNPHIVEFYESGVDGESYFYAMEYVPGETLMNIIHREKRIPWQRALEIAMQVCQALKSAHDTGIIHRDLKPSNLMVTPDGTVKLTDFGVAQVFASQRLTVTGGIIGTAEYMSPEQAQGKRATKQSDLYSLGAVLYTIITGRVPFSGKTMVEVIQKHKFGLFDRPRLIVPDLPIRVEETICRLLEKEPEKRFPDALVLLRHLDHLLQVDAGSSHGMTLTGFEDEGDPLAQTVAAVPEVTSPGHRESRTERPGPATMMQKLLRAELGEGDAPQGLNRIFNNTIFQVAVLVLVVGSAVWWWRSRQLTPEQMFEAGSALMEQQAGPEWLRARREYFDPLVKSDPVAWEERAAPFLRQIELYELTRAPRGGKLAAKKAESEPERLLQLAAQYQRLGDLARAERILSGLKTLLAGDEAQRKLYEQAVQLLDEIAKQRGTGDDKESFAEQAAARAELLLKEGKREEARALWTAIVQLYSDDPQAAPIVTEAESALERTREPKE